MAVNNGPIETVLLANSDEHLAKAEEAKRQGTALESVAAAPSAIVPREVARDALHEVSKKDTAVGPHGNTFAAHLEEYHEAIQDPEFVTKSNEQKAQEHNDYSAELVRQREAEDAQMREKIAEGYNVAEAIQEKQQQMAEDYNEQQASFAKDRPMAGASVFEVHDMVREIRVEDLAKPIEALKGKLDVPNVSEDATRESLITKDAITATQKPFHGKPWEVISAEAHHGTPEPVAQKAADIGSQKQAKVNKQEEQAAAEREKAQKEAADQAQKTQKEDNQSKQSEQKPPTLDEEKSGEESPAFKEVPPEQAQPQKTKK